MEETKACDFTVCALCKNALSNARLLPCLDSFCLKCLKVFAADQQPGDTVECPTCEDSFRIPDQGLACLPVNLFVERLQMLRMSSDAVSPAACDVCASETEEPSPVTSYCVDCQQYMCQQCSSYHVKFASTRQHKVKVMSRGSGGRTSTNLEKDFCERHEDRRYELYCEDCSATICLKCYTDKHNSHTCSDIDAVAEDFRQQMEKNIDEMEHLTIENDWEERDLCKARDDILGQMTDAELTVLRHREELISCVERDTNELLNDLQYFRGIVNSEFDASSGKIRKRSEKIGKFRQFTREVLKDGTSSVIADVKSSVSQRASEFRAQHLSCRSKRRPCVDVVFQPLGLSRLSQAATNSRRVNVVGRVTASVITAAPPPPSVELSNLLSAGTSPFLDFMPGSKSSPADSDRLSMPTKQVTPGRRRLRAAKPRKSSPRGSVHFRSTALTALRIELNSSSLKVDSSSSDEEIEDTDDIFQLAADETAKADEPDSVLDSQQGPVTATDQSVQSGGSTSSADPVPVMFSHVAKLYRFVDGRWKLRGIGDIEVTQLVDKNMAYVLMRNTKTQKLCLKQPMLPDVSLHQDAADSDGRQLTMVASVADHLDTDHTEMYMVRFQSKDQADAFHKSFTCARQLMRLSVVPDSDQPRPVLAPPSSASSSSSQPAAAAAATSSTTTTNPGTPTTPTGTTAVNEASASSCSDDVTTSAQQPSSVCATYPTFTDDF